MHIDITKIVVHKVVINSEEEMDTKRDTVFIFTPHKLDEDNFLSILVHFPPDGHSAQEWVEREIGTTTYEVVREGMEVKAPE